MKIEQLFTHVAATGKPILAVSNKDDCQVWLHPEYPNAFVGFPITELNLDNLTEGYFPMYSSVTRGGRGGRAMELLHPSDDYVITLEF